MIDYAGMAARRDQVVKRLWTGLKSLVDKNKVTWIQGQGKLDGPTHVRVKMAPDADNPGGERVLQGTDVILATGSRVKSLPGLEPDGKRIITSDDVLTGDTAAEGRHRRRGRRGRRRVRVDVPRPRREDDAARVPARRSCRSRTARSARRWSGASRAAA